MTTEPYDFDAAIAKCRAAMKKPDLTTWSTLALARTTATRVRDEFPHDQLHTIAHAMIYNTGSLGNITHAIPASHGQNFLAVTILNIQACAGVMILDQLEIDELEASLKASS